LKLRAQRELQAQHRAVTTQDYEQFTLSCSRSVARARCLTPSGAVSGSSGTVSVLVVPAVADALHAGNLAALHMQDSLQSEIRTYLDQYRLLTTTLQVREPRYIGVKVQARIVPQDFVRPADVEQRVREELQRYLTPLAIDSQTPLLQNGEKWDGWPFGRDLFTAEVISLIQQVPSVKYVLDVEVCSRTVVPVEEKVVLEDAAPVELRPVDKVLQIPEDTLLCSLDHEIETVTIQEIYKKG
jgi:predicted phage baseplate assembly protein